jgi:hypothetical protein
MLGSSWVAAQLVASQEGLSSMSTGTFVYIFSMSNEQSFVFSSALVCVSAWVNTVEFCTLNVCGSCNASCNILFKCFATLYAGQFFQFTIGRIGWSFYETLLCHVRVRHLDSYLHISIYYLSYLCSDIYLFPSVSSFVVSLWYHLAVS